MDERLIKGLTPREERDIVLDKAQELISQIGWTKHAAARDKFGDAIAWQSPAAKSFCLLGAIARGTMELDVSLLARDWAKQAIYKVISLGISDYNDNPDRTKEQVLQVISLAKEQEL